MTAFWISLIYVFVAEMGDKTQLVALAFATKYKTRTVLAGVFLATFAVHLISVLVGGALSHVLPVFWLKIVAGLSFRRIRSSRQVRTSSGTICTG